MHVIANSILPGDLVFDIGANQGDKSAWFLERGARVVCVEPQPAMAEILARRFSDNPSATLVQMGVGAKPGQLDMSINSGQPVLSTFSERWKTGRFKNHTWDRVVSVDITTLDALVERFGSPRYVKIDVEGWEAQVVSGLSRKIGCLSFEFTAELIDDAAAACRHLQDVGYEKFNASFGEMDAFITEGWHPAGALLDILNRSIVNDGLLWGDIYAV